MSSFKTLLIPISFGILFVASAVIAFGILMTLGYYESHTGIETGATPLFALAGAAVFGLFARRVSVFFGGREFSRLAAIAGWLVFLATGSLVVWAASGGQDLGPTGDGFHRDFEWWQAAASVFGPFGFGLLVRTIIAKAKAA